MKLLNVGQLNVILLGFSDLKGKETCAEVGRRLEMSCKLLFPYVLKQSQCEGCLFS